MPSKVFISYSHKDEKFKDELVEHISGLVRNGDITEWNDRKIIPASDWSAEISSQLLDSDLILFLVSSSFLSSDYCIDIEASKAIEMHDAGQAQLIPIIVRSTDWSSSPIAKFQGLPKDAKPIDTWGNLDEAWLNVVSGIRKHINEFVPKADKSQAFISSDEDGLVVSPYINEWIEDTEITLTHRNVKKVKLSDVYVVPDVELLNENNKELKSFRSAEDVINDCSRIVISGDEQQGKTSLLKYYYKSLLICSNLPLIINGEEVKDSSVLSLIAKELARQYEGITLDNYLETPDKVVIIDNLDKVPLNKKFRDKFIFELCSIFEKCIFTVQSSFSLLMDEIPALDDFDKIDILVFGNKKREELIRNWISLGVIETISDEELYSKCDELKDAINSVVKKNIVPPKPIYILMLLQMFEANSKLSLELSSHGHCYQQLIYQAFSNAKIHDNEYDKYLNVLTELAWKIFINEGGLNNQQLRVFFNEYCDLYLDIEQEVVMPKLVKHSILCHKDLGIDFKYPYIYYFFVGKKISEAYSEYEEVQLKVDYLLDNMHREDCANILIFVTHHTKETWVINKIQDVLSNLFSEHLSATLDRRQLAFMDDFMRQIPELIIEQREIQRERDEYNEKLDKHEVTSDEEFQDESPDLLANINKTFKGMEVAGQIIRNRHASLRRDSLTLLAESGINAGLRFLKYFIVISDASKKEIVKVISSHLEENPELSNSQVEKFAENAYLHLTYGVINAVVRKISTSVGSKEAMQIYRMIEDREPTPALHLLKLSIELYFFKKINIDSIETCMTKLSDNTVCARIVKELVVRHIYMFPVNFKDKQKLSSLLNISVRGQSQIEMKRKRIS
ncbi:TIR domain-containing protein [Cobetia sp. MB87]|uniref:NACHT domain-containing protein n=1 Tax=Cobetia sp. MB87 TaxID=2588451 RepID=UPI00140C8E26|nr:TIR domain-containing protein [Cobetia sp. MB87]NHH85339.1 hypothetical protein [Cobetia sp. MB87]